MVTDNIVHVLGSFLRCSEFDNVVFCWVMHRQEIIDGLLAQLSLDDVRIVNVMLTCTPEALTERIRRDVSDGLREESAVGRALAYLPLYQALRTVKLDTTALTPAEAAERITAE